MTTRPYELLVRFGKTPGSVAGVAIRYITELNGKEYEGDPEPLAGTNDPAFIVFAEQFGAAAVAERDTLREEKMQLINDSNALRRDNQRLQELADRLTTDNETLASKILELTYGNQDNQGPVSQE